MDITTKELVTGGLQIPFYSTFKVQITPGEAAELAEDEVGNIFDITLNRKCLGIENLEEAEGRGYRACLLNSDDYWVCIIPIPSINVKVTFEDELRVNLEKYVHEVVIKPYEDMFHILIRFNKIEPEREFSIIIERW